MPQDDTLEANRHHTHRFPLFRSHLTRDTAAMFPLRQNPVVSTKHECRSPHLPAVSHIENDEEEARWVVSGLPKLYNVYGVTITMTLPVTQCLDDKGETMEIIKSIQRHSSQRMEGHTELDLLQHEVN